MDEVRGKVDRVDWLEVVEEGVDRLVIEVVEEAVEDEVDRVKWRSSWRRLVRGIFILTAKNSSLPIHLFFAL